MRLSEIYSSIQGEGPNMGCQTLFVRFAGCNLRCPGWSCDTQHAIDPARYRHEWQNVAPDELCQQIDAVLKRPRAYTGPLVTLTGGEPFLQPTAELEILLHSLWSMGVRIECFTNGSLPWCHNARNTINHFILDWKLPGSGEMVDDAVVLQNIDRLQPRDAVKFTLVDRNDFDQAIDRYSRYLHNREYGPSVYLGPVWGKVTEAEVSDWLLQSDYPELRLNLQAHKFIWPADERLR